MIVITGDRDRVSDTGHHIWMVVNDPGKDTLTRWLEVNCDEQWHIHVLDKSYLRQIEIIALVFDSESDRDVCYLRFV